jgi:hypothetical protein
VGSVSSASSRMARHSGAGRASWRAAPPVCVVEISIVATVVSRPTTHPASSSAVPSSVRRTRQIDCASAQPLRCGRQYLDRLSSEWKPRARLHYSGASMPASVTDADARAMIAA